MYESLKNNDIVLTNNKKEILNYLSKNNKILNVRIMTLNEFKDNYFGYYDEKAIYYLIKKYNYKYEIAKMYLDNFLFDIELRKELEKNNLIIHTPLFKEAIKRIVIDNINVDPYIMSEIEKYEYIFLTNFPFFIIFHIFPPAYILLKTSFFPLLVSLWFYIWFLMLLFQIQITFFAFVTRIRDYIFVFMPGILFHIFQHGF